MVQVRRHSCQLRPHYVTPGSLPNSSIWTKIKDRIRKSTTMSLNHPYTSQFFRSNKQFDKEVYRHTLSNLWLSIHPFSMFWYCWTIFMMFLYIIVVLVDAYKQCVLYFYMEESLALGPIYYWELFNFLCVINVILHFFTGYVEYVIVEKFEMSLRRITEPNIVLDKSKIAKNYVKSFFFFDILALLDLFDEFLSSYFPSGTVIYIFKFLPIIRIVRFYTAMRTAEMIICQVLKRQHMFKVFLCGFSTMCTLYFSTCLQIAVPYLTNYFSFLQIEIFRDTYSVADETISSSVYFISTFYKVTNNFIGFPVNYVSSNLCEKIIRYSIVFIGHIHLAWFLSIIIPFYNSRYESWLHYNDFSNTLYPFIAHANSSSGTENRIRKYFQNTFQSEMFQEEKILCNLNDRLRCEIFARSSMDLIRKCHLFHRLSNKTISSLAACLKYETYVPGQRVVKFGDPAICMYFIASGEVAVYSLNGYEICHLSEGDYFGEMGLIRRRRRRTADVITVEDLKLFRLDAVCFNKVVKPLKKMYTKLERELKSRTSILKAKSSIMMSNPIHSD